MFDPATLHREAIVIDGHADTPQRFVDEAWDFTDSLGTGMVNLETALAGGLTAQFFAAWAEPLAWQGRFAERTLELIESVHGQVRRSEGRMTLGRTAADIVEAKREGKFCALLGIEGGHSIENSLDLLRRYHELGVRYMTLTWSNTNEWADSSGDEHDPAVKHHGGLTTFGRSVVREMNRLGMMVDVSHVADNTLQHVLETTHAPVIASHSSARSLTDVPRNLTDQQLRAIATTNGVVMVNFYPSFIDLRWHDAWAATAGERIPLYEAAALPFHVRNEPPTYGAALAVDRSFYLSHLAPALPLAPFVSLIDHIDHVAQVAGIDHVGLGSDFDGFALLPAGIRSAADLPSITAALATRGYTAEQLRKVLGGNILRVMDEVQREARSE